MTTSKPNLDFYKTELSRLYMQTAKHSSYQVLPRKLREAIDFKPQKTLNHYELERLEFLKNHLDVRGKSLLDIGGNTGFFSFELLEQGASQIEIYEGNPAYCEFACIAARALGVQDKVKIHPRYIQFDSDVAGLKADVLLLLNVLHHIGDDFGNADLNISSSLDKIAQILRSLSPCAGYLVFQIGFCWHGNRSTVLFQEGTKKQIIDFVNASTEGHWDIEHIGIAWPTDHGIEYQYPNEVNMVRRDDLKEFLNRPLLILKSRNYRG